MNRVLTVAALAAFIMLVMAGDPPPALAQTPDVDATAQEKLAALENALQALQRQIDELRAGLLGQVGDPADVSMAGMATAGASPAVVRALADPLVDESELPPLGWTCPMHPEIHETHAGGVCPICKMDLVETRRAEAWTCPVHSVILEAAGGVCPIGGRELIPIRLQLTWTCPDHLDVSSLQPGMCPIDGGQRLVQRLAALPHEDHTPKHGGTFFMAPDNWHHVEGTYPEPGRFRPPRVRQLLKAHGTGADQRARRPRGKLRRCHGPDTRVGRVSIAGVLATVATSKPPSGLRTCRLRLLRRFASSPTAPRSDSTSGSPASRRTTRRPYPRRRPKRRWTGATSP